jgi:hypothetical protein
MSGSLIICLDVMTVPAPDLSDDPAARDVVRMSAARGGQSHEENR